MTINYGLYFLEDLINNSWHHAVTFNQSFPISGLYSSTSINAEMSGLMKSVIFWVMIIGIYSLDVLIATNKMLLTWSSYTSSTSSGVPINPSWLGVAVAYSACLQHPHLKNWHPHHSQLFYSYSHR